jgi:hypothetical protein
LCISLVAFKDQPLLWRSFPASDVSLSEGGAVATQTKTVWNPERMSLTTTETELTEGKHYWEVELLNKGWSETTKGQIFIGISKPNLDHTGAYVLRECTDGWFIGDSNGSLWGNGEFGDGYRAGEYKQGDCVGVLLDLGNGSLRFFKNGVRHGPGYAAGSVTGPVVAAVQMANATESVRLISPNDETPGQWPHKRKRCGIPSA